MSRYVLDAGAALAFFKMEPGFEKVREILGEAGEGRSRVFISAVNLGEVYYIVGRESGRDKAEKAVGFLEQIGCRVAADRELSLSAAGLKLTRKLPYADAHAAALAIREKAVLVAKDGDFESIEDDVKVQWLVPSK